MSKRLAVAALSVLALGVAAGPAYAQGNAPAKLSFFSASGAEAHWQHDESDSPNDDNAQDIELVTSAPGGYAGVSVMNVEGTPTAEYPASSFEVKSDSGSVGPSLGSPRLVILFDDGGRAELRPLNNTTSWQTVDDPNWDNNGGTCGYVPQTTWSNVQSCHAGTTVTNVFMVADPYDRMHWIDNLNTAGVVFNDAKDNGNRS